MKYDLLALSLFVLLAGCTNVQTTIDQTRAPWEIHWLLVERAGSMSTERFEQIAAHEAEVFCRAHGQAVEAFVGEQRTDDIFFATFRCMAADRVLQVPDTMPRCALAPSGDPVWASMLPGELLVLFADSSLLQLSVHELTPGPHEIHLFDGDRLSINSPPHTFGSFYALAGSYTVESESEQLTLRIDELPIVYRVPGSLHNLPHSRCWQMLEPLVVDVRRPVWRDTRRCERRFAFTSGPGRLALRRDDAPGQWVDAETGPTLASSFADPSLRVRLGVAPRPGSPALYGFGEGSGVELHTLVDGREFVAVSGILRLELLPGGELSGIFSNVVFVSRDEPRCYTLMYGFGSSIQWRADAPEPP